MRYIDVLWGARESIRSGRGDLERKREASLQLLGEAVYRRIADGDGRTLEVDESMREATRAILACDAELAEMAALQRAHDRELAEEATRNAITSAEWAMVDDWDDMTFICPNCFTRTSIELDYCVGCGQPVKDLVLHGVRLQIEEQHRKEEAAQERCPHCGAPLPERYKMALFCPSCGAKRDQPSAGATVR